MFKLVDDNPASVATRRRLSFADTTLHLYVWLEPDGKPFGFQLLYWMKGKDAGRYGLTWTRAEGLRAAWLQAVEGGSQQFDPGSNMSGMSVAELPLRGVPERFAAASKTLPPNVQRMVQEKLASITRPGKRR